MGSREGARRVFIALILLALGLVFVLAWPFGSALIFAMVLSATLFPLHRRLTSRFRGQESLSAGLICLGVILLLLIPMGGVAAFIISETLSGVRFVSQTVQSDGMLSLIDNLPSWLQHPAHVLVDSLAEDPQRLNEELRRRASTHGGQVARVMSQALTATGAILVQLTMALIALFFLLVDGARFVSWIEENSPLMKGQVRELLTEFRTVSRSVLVSSVLTAGVQAIAALLGYLIAGAPQALFFGLLTFLIAFIPAVGAGGVCLFVALLMLVIGKTWAAIFLGLWVLPVGLVDNLIKPLLVRRDMHMHGGVIFFALVGGIAAFGLVGLLLGPLVVTFLLALVRIYSRDFGDGQTAPL